MRYWCLIFVLGLLWSCDDDSDAPVDSQPNDPVSVIPAITLAQVAPTSVQEFQDSIVFTLCYLDGDGDLGFEQADSTSIRLIDNRDAVNLMREFHVPPLAPIGAGIAIQGKLNVVLNRTNLINGTTTETTTYTLQMRDRAGNWSNEVTTGTITINP